MTVSTTPDYKACFDLSPAAQVILDSHGGMVDVNGRACLLLGYDRQALLGRRLVDLVHSEDRPQVDAVIRHSAENKQPFEVDCRVQSTEQGVRWYAVQSTPSLVNGGHTVWYAVFSDITEHKLYLDAKLAADTAERASQAKSSFLSRMSHELRTPLNAVIGFAQLLKIDKQQQLTDPQRRKVDLIERSGAHLLAVISDVLDLSRIEAGDMPLSLDAIYVDTAVSDAFAMVADAAAVAQVCLPDPLMDQGLALVADRVRLRQVLVNLLSNAIKYNRPAGTVQVRAWHEDASVVLEVSDTGVGLSPEQQAHLFEPFNRLGAEYSGVEGTGIGLVIVHRLVELMDGTISVTSEPGVGTTFTLRLPAADLGQPSDHAPLMDFPAQSHAATVLYAEDNDVNVMLVRQILELRPSWTLVVATSGAQALQMIQASRPDLLLLDMHLGDMSGFDLVELLEKDAATQNIIKVALSADAMPDRIHAARAKGFSAYLTKPLDVAALLRCLDEQLSTPPP